MNIVKKLGLVAATLAMLLCGTYASATTLKYDITGTGSGQIGGVTFTDQAFDISFIGDAVGATLEINPLSSAQLSVEGLGTAILNLGTRIGINTSNQVVFFSRSSGADLFDFYLTTPLLNLNDQFSVTGNSVFALEQFVSVDSSLGDITFHSSSDVVFTSVFVSSVPEAETFAMLLAGLGLVGVMVRRKPGRTAA